MWSEEPDHVIEEVHNRRRMDRHKRTRCNDPAHEGCPRCEPDAYLDAMTTSKDGHLWFASFAGYEATGWNKQTAKRRLLEKLRS